MVEQRLSLEHISNTFKSLLMPEHDNDHDHDNDGEDDDDDLYNGLSCCGFCRNLF